MTSLHSFLLLLLFIYLPIQYAAVDKHAFDDGYARQAPANSSARPWPSMSVEPHLQSESYVLLPHVAVRLRCGANATRVAQRNGYVVRDSTHARLIGHTDCERLYLFEPHRTRRHLLDSKEERSSMSVADLHRFTRTLPSALSLDDDEDVLWFERQHAYRQYRRDLWTNPIDPTYMLPSSEEYGTWFISGVNARRSVNIIGLWHEGLFGDGMNIIIIDDGLELEHPDLKPNFVADMSWDTVQQKALGNARNNENHGTPAAGCCCGANNAAILNEEDPSKLPYGACGVGVAPRVKFGFVKTPGSQTDFTESFAFNFRLDQVDVQIDMSGPPDSGTAVRGPGPLTVEALRRATAEARDGLGSVIVWAAGNGHDRGDQCGMDGYVSSRYTIAAGAVTSRGYHAFYSEACAAMMMTVPSNGDEIGIWGPDLLGSRGTSAADCNSDFGGTSAAAAIGGGCMALLLQAAPTLSWLDVQGVIVYASDFLLPGDASWRTNAAGVRHNNKLGFGVVNVARWVELARKWTAYGASFDLDSPDNTLDVPLTFDAPVERTYVVPDTPAAFVKHAEVVISTSGPRGDQLIELISPSGTVSDLATVRADQGNGYTKWRLTSVAFWDEAAAGEWRVRVTDKVAANDGRWTFWSLHLHCTPESTKLPAEFVPYDVEVTVPPTPSMPTQTFEILRPGDCIVAGVGCAPSKAYQCCTGVCVERMLGMSILRTVCLSFEERCSDGMLNGDEEEIDCGGGCPNACRQSSIDERCTPVQLNECHEMCGEVGINTCRCEPGQAATAMCPVAPPDADSMLLIYVGAGAGAAVLLCLCVLVVCCMLARRRARQRRMSTKFSIGTQSPPVDASSTSAANVHRSSRRRSLKRRSSHEATHARVSQKQSDDSGGVKRRQLNPQDSAALLGLPPNRASRHLPELSVDDDESVAPPPPAADRALPRRPSVCELCSKRRSTQRASEQNQWTCRDCAHVPAQRNGGGDGGEQLAVSASVPAFKCKYCEKQYESKGLLDTHVELRHRQAAPEKVMSMQLTTEERRDAPKRRGSMPIGSSTNGDIELQKNPALKGDGAEGAFSCPYCDKKYPIEGLLDAHISVRHVENVKK